MGKGDRAAHGTWASFYRVLRVGVTSSREESGRRRSHYLGRVPSRHGLNVEDNADMWAQGISGSRRRVRLSVREEGRVATARALLGRCWRARLPNW